MWRLFVMIGRGYLYSRFFSGPSDPASAACNRSNTNNFCSLRTPTKPSNPQRRLQPGIWISTLCVIGVFMNVLVTGVGGGVGQSVIRSLRNAKLHTWIMGVDADPWGAGLYLCDEHSLVPFVSDENRYINTLKQIITKHKIEVLIPGTDTELLTIALYRHQFEELGCIPIVSTAECISLCRDKTKTGDVLSPKGIPFVRTLGVVEFLKATSKIIDPVIVKPKGGSGSVGARVIFRREEIENINQPDSYIVQDYLVPAAWKLSTISPFDVLRGGRLRQDDELSIQGMIGPDGSTVGIYASVNRLRDGVPIVIQPTKSPDIISFAAKVFKCFAEIGHIGPCNIQGRLTKNGPVLFEVNPRFTGITAVRAEMGFNECEAAIRLFVLKEDTLTVAESLDYDEKSVGVRYVTEHIVRLGDTDQDV